MHKVGPYAFAFPAVLPELHLVEVLHVEVFGIQGEVHLRLYVAGIRRGCLVELRHPLYLVGYDYGHVAVHEVRRNYVERLGE